MDEGEELVELGPYRLRAVLLNEVAALHTYVIKEVSGSQFPDMVPRAFVDALQPDPTVVINELCRAGMWEPFMGGYRILDTLMLRKIQGMRCIAQGGHTVSNEIAVMTPDGSHQVCARCAKTLMPEDPIL